MKKSLFALAATTAIAGAAQAQSSVNVYGLLDLGYVGYNTRTATGNAFLTSAESASRLGFKGTEDLGGGTSAFFTVETGLTPNTSSRQTFVGLKKNNLGQFALGTQNTLIQNAVTATDPGQNNIAGSVLYPAFTEVTGSTENSTGAAYTVRTNNQLSLNSATFSGFQANAMLAMNNNKNPNKTTNVAGITSETTGSLNNKNGWGLGLNYTLNKLYATANYQALTSKQPAQKGDNAAAPGKNVDNQWYLAATYDFGILKAYAQYIHSKIPTQQNNSSYLRRTSEQIGVRSFITPTIEAWASGGLGRYAGFGTSTAKMASWQIGSNYWLSKRTNLYAIYGQTGINPTYSNLSNYAIGVRHTF